jgi:YgiT-type zinc finger domain-containing protein
VFVRLRYTTLDKYRTEKPRYLQSCGADEQKPGVRDIKQTYKGRVNIIKDVHAGWCDLCGEAELDAGSGPEGKEEDRVLDEAGAFVKKVDQEQSD